MKTYIVMPHYIITEHVAELAKQTIKSFKETAKVTLISCDDASPYKDIDFLKEMSDVYIRNKKNKGFAGNCNVGFKWVLKHEKDDCYIVCANNDIKVYNNWLEEFDKVLDAFNGDLVGGLGYRVEIVEGMPLEQYSINPQSKHKMNCISEGGRLDDWMFPGGFWMMKKSVLEDVGLLDENYLHGGYEDIDLFYRAHQAGKKLLMTPKVAYWHEEGATRFSKQEKERQDKVEPENRAYFKQKHGFDAHEKLNKILTDNRINL